MKKSQRWVTYGLASAVGVAVVGGAAVYAADALTLRTGDGAILPGGPAVGTAQAPHEIDPIAFDFSSDQVSVITPATPVAAPTTVTPNTPPETVSAPGAAPAPAAPPAVATADPTTVTPATAVTTVTPATPADSDTPPSPAD
ncbi:MAG: hypothetical protein ACK5LN_04125 [Propioniciclava sp.]